MRGLGAKRLLACRGQVAPQFLSVVKGPGEALLQVPDLTAAAGNELVHLTAAVSAHLHFEGVFVNEVRQEITVVIHGFPRSLLSDVGGDGVRNLAAQDRRRVAKVIRRDCYLCSMRAGRVGRGEYVHDSCL